MSLRLKLLLVVARSSVFLIIAALVIVPTILRARQHVKLHEATRLSIRLNWQSDAPPHRMVVVPDEESTGVAATIPLSPQPEDARLSPRVHSCSEPIVQAPFDNAPDLFRGPPSSRI
jgi:hypothetical protein